MQLRKFYENSGVDYNALIRRLAGNEALLYKYLKSFVEDKNYTELCKAVMSKDYDTVLKTAHSIKGMSINLGLEKLFEISSAIVISVREEHFDKVEPFWEQLKSEYARVISQIGMLEYAGA